MLKFGIVSCSLRCPGDNGSWSKHLIKRPSGVVREGEGSSQLSTEDVMSGRVCVCVGFQEQLHELR